MARPATPKPSHHPRPARWMAVGLLLSGGCLLGQYSKVKRTGVDVPESTFAQITPGRTTGAWVRATLGEPTATTDVTPGDQVLRYVYTEQVDSSGYVFLIFGGSSTNENKRQALIEVKDGVVTRKWRA